MYDQITPLIITYNEAANIRRTLEKLNWARRILVIDSGSTDETLSILREYANLDVIQHRFESFAAQCNFGLTHIATEWALSLDADYDLSNKLVQELGNLSPFDDIAGYRAHFVYRIHGRPLRGTVYPPRVVLYRKAKAFYRNDGHGHRVCVCGKVNDLSGVIYHDDRKPLARWVATQEKYASAEARHLLDAPRGSLSKVDRIRRMGWPAPLLVFFYVLLGKGCILNGWAGWQYTLQRVAVEMLIALEIIEHRLRQQP